ncbi:hypothetical protein HY415_01330 [Candidatus Kaiserbacteria bacterium]|nr:hypothetical protein [Candidatus Kaiserbacteria bacterium]
MVKDQKIVLPRSMGRFTISGEPEKGKAVWYSISFRHMEYKVDYRGSVEIRGTVRIRKEKQVFGESSGRPKRFFVALPVWEFSTKWAYLTDGGYKSSIASEALNSGVVLSPGFFAELCKEPEKQLADLQRRIEREFSPQPHLARVA